jgi:DNA-binding PadR family transcriptional regulator
MPGDMLNDPLEQMLAGERSEEEAQINADKAALARDSERKLIHRVFRQTPSGVELLELWIDKHLIHTDPIRKGEQHDTNDIALEVGLQNFIRAINRACEGIDNQKPE